MVQLGAFLGLRMSTKSWFALKGNVLQPLAKSILILLGLTATASATDAAIQKKVFVLGRSTLIFSNEHLNDIMKVVKSIEDAGLLTKGFSETVENEVKERK